MNEQFTRPKSFGEILDQTFRLIKNRFADFFMILLILVGPMILLTAIIQLLSGTSFFREFTGEGAWIEQFIATLDQQTNDEFATTPSPGGNFLLTIIGMFNLAAIAVAEAAILLVVYHIRNKQNYTVGSTIREAFSRFWAIIISNIVFSLILFGLIIVPLIMVFIMAFTGGIGGIIFGLILLIGFGVGIGYLLVRWSFYLGFVMFEDEFIGVSRSWEFTRGRAWPLMGLYIVFFLITGAITLAIEGTFTALLGSSVLLSIITNLASLFTTMIFAVGFAVMFFDQKARHGADDLQHMIDEYEE